MTISTNKERKHPFLHAVRLLPDTEIPGGSLTHPLGPSSAPQDGRLRPLRATFAAMHRRRDRVARA